MRILPKLTLAIYLYLPCLFAQQGPLPSILAVDPVPPELLLPGGTLKLTLSAKPAKKEDFALWVNGKPYIGPGAKWTDDDTKVSFTIDKELAGNDAAWKALFSQSESRNVSAGPATGPALPGAAVVWFRPLEAKVVDWARKGNRCGHNEKKDDDSCLARLGDSIEVIVADLNFPKDAKIVMWIDGRPMPGVEAQIGRPEKNGETTLSFLWSKSLPSLEGSKESWLSILRRESTSSLRLSVGTLTGPPLPSNMVFDIRRISEEALWGWGILIALAAVGTFALALKTKLLKEDEGRYSEDTTSDRAYSLAKTQLIVWTFVVAACYTFVWLVTWNEDVMTPRVLVLLGISIGTVVIGTVVDNSKKDQAASVIKASNVANVPSKGTATDAATSDPVVNEAIATLTTPKNEHFFMDLISDRNGPSVARVQMVLFTLILMGIFIIEVISTLVMPQFSDTLLGLMGISTAGYLTMKIPEQKIQPPPVK